MESPLPGVLEEGGAQSTATTSNATIDIALLTGGFDRPYVFGLARALLSVGVSVDLLGSDDLNIPELRSSARVRFLNLRGPQRQDAGLAQKAGRILAYYRRLIAYAGKSKAKIFHILWNNKFEYFDRTLLLLYYRFLGKRIIFTAHNVNAGKRDGNDSWPNRLTLRIQYRLVDHIFVHTEKMKRELIEDFRVPENRVTVIPFGINNSVPDTDLAPMQARELLGINGEERVILFFGNIGPYKGVHFLVDAFQKLATQHPSYRLIIAGKARGGCEQYLADIQESIRRGTSQSRIIQKIGYVPDADTEVYFKAADLLVLPYTHVSQSGVLFLAYSFGLPVVVTDVGSLKDDVVEGVTGFVCPPEDSKAFADAIGIYFESDLFEHLDRHRQNIKDYAHAHHSWDVVGQMTRRVYERLLEERPS